MRRTLVIGVLVWVVVTVAAFVFLDAILGSAVGIVGAVLLALTAAAADWERHSTFEEREMERARRREAKWAQGAEARARDRARWEAYQARQAAKADRAGEAGRDDDRTGER